MILEGLVVGGFVLGHRLVERGDQSVWTARHELLRYPAAVHCTFGGHGQATVMAQRALRAARLHRSCAELHPAFVRSLDAGVAFVTEGRIAYAVYEWVDGTSIEESLRQPEARAMTPRAAFDVLLPAARAIHLLHRSGAAHGDLDGSHLIVPRAPLTLKIIGVWPTKLPVPVAQARDVSAFAHVLLELLVGRVLLASDHPEQALGGGLAEELGRAREEKSDIAKLWSNLSAIFSREGLWDQVLFPVRSRSSGVYDSARIVGPRTTDDCHDVTLRIPPIGATG